MHPHSNNWHLIGYVIVRQRDRQDVRVTKTVCGAECWTDHRLLISKMNIQMQPPRRPQGRCPSDSTSSGKDIKQKLVWELISKLRLPNPDLQADVEAEWGSLRDAVYAATLDVLGPVTRQHQD